MTGATQTIAMMITVRKLIKTDWSVRQALIGKIRKKTPCVFKMTFMC